MKLNTLPAVLTGYGAALGLALFGLLLAWYGFELVSVPNVREYHEIVYIGLGAVLMAAGLAYGVMRAKGASRKKKSAVST